MGVTPSPPSPRLRRVRRSAVLVGAEAEALPNGIMAIVTLSAGVEPEALHRACWYGRRTPHLPADLSLHTIEDGELLYCAHPMLFPIVGYAFDTRNCVSCEYFKRRRVPPPL